MAKTVRLNSDDKIEIPSKFFTSVLDKKKDLLIVNAYYGKVMPFTAKGSRWFIAYVYEQKAFGIFNMDTGIRYGNKNGYISYGSAFKGFMEDVVPEINKTGYKELLKISNTVKSHFASSYDKDIFFNQSVDLYNATELSTTGFVYKLFLDDVLSRKPKMSISSRIIKLGECGKIPYIEAVLKKVQRMRTILLFPDSSLTKEQFNHHNIVLRRLDRMIDFATNELHYLKEMTDMSKPVYPVDIKGIMNSFDKIIEKGIDKDIPKSFVDKISDTILYRLSYDQLKYLIKYYSFNGKFLPLFHVNYKIVTDKDNRKYYNARAQVIKLLLRAVKEVKDYFIFNTQNNLYTVNEDGAFDAYYSFCRDEKIMDNLTESVTRMNENVLLSCGNKKGNSKNDANFPWISGSSEGRNSLIPLLQPVEKGYGRIGYNGSNYFIIRSFSINKNSLSDLVDENGIVIWHFENVNVKIIPYDSIKKAIEEANDVPLVKQYVVKQYINTYVKALEGRLKRNKYALRRE